MRKGRFDEVFFLSLPNSNERELIFEVHLKRVRPSTYQSYQLNLLSKITKGQATKDDLAAIEEVSETITNNSLCGLGKSAANPINSTLRYFREEYEAHLRGNCPAGVCRELINYQITDDCTGCLLCIKNFLLC